jgi:Ca2+-binding EF-hand superfamily protein
MTGVELA